MKEIGIGVAQYSQDYDEVLPPPYSGCSLNASGNGEARCPRWMDVVYPYVKSEQIFTCPSSSANNLFKLDVNGRFSMSSSANAGFWLGTYSWNVSYWGNGGPGNRGPFMNTSLSDVGDPSGTVNVTERNQAVTNTNGENSWRDQAASNAAGFLQPAANPPLLNNQAARHLGTMNVLFCDGHVKAMSVDALNQRNTAGDMSLWTIQKD
jgi:prepilin-type processing-associated H-X9-DG protein